MKWLILLALFSCSTAKKTETPVVAADKPASPYTVQPCVCMKIFKPVCANGQNYGNSCEAECHGNKTWTDGQCGPKKK
jgi:hypothetical protein